MENRLLVDGNYLLHKNFHTFKNFRVGELFTGTTYGLLRDVHKYATQYNTKRVCVTWDARSFRKDLSNDYKAQRKIDTSVLNPYSSVELVHEACSAFGFTQYKVEGYESDDLLYTLSRDSNYSDVVLSSDEDLLSCLSEHTSVHLVKKKVLLTKSNFESHYGYPFSEDSYVKYKCYVGDKSDNVKGVPRVKKSTVIKLLRGEQLSASESQLLSQHTNTVVHNESLFKLQLLENLTPYSCSPFDSDAVTSLLQKTRIKSLSAVVNYFKN